MAVVYGKDSSQDQTPKRHTCHSEIGYKSEYRHHSNFNSSHIWEGLYDCLKGKKNLHFDLLYLLVHLISSHHLISQSS